MATIFVSPGVYTKEQDFSVFASRIGITRLGLVGKTAKGPAFEPIKISSTDEYLLRFGGTDPELPASYVANSFLGQSNELTVTRILGNSGFVNSPAWLLVASGGTLDGSTLAVLRSKHNQVSNTFYLNEESDVIVGAVTSALGDFILSATTGPLTAVTNSGYTVSLDETKDSYIVKILGKNPKDIGGTPQLYVERIYPHFLREAVNRGAILFLSGAVFTEETAYTDFEDSYTNAITPYVVSRVVGGQVKDLFRFQTISDGDASSREIKISIANIDLVNYTFDVIVRNFNDTDATAASTALERWSNVSLDPTSTTYIGKVIGTTDESYPRKSMFITVDIVENVSSTAIPAGFRGYELRSTGISGTTPADIYYKTEYFSGDSKFKTYLGISELGYTSLTQSQVTVRTSVKTLETDLFAYDGGTTSGKTSIKGFHMENTADPSEFISGNKNSLTAYTNDAQTLLDKTLLKFTLVPYGGFDGWNKYRQYDVVADEFSPAYQDNVTAFKNGIDTMASPEDVDINLFVTPGVEFETNTDIITYALDMIESRADSLYIMDAPRITVGTEKGTPEELVSILENTGIDSNYAATYWPWIQIEDNASNVYTYQSPTLMVVRAMAYTDNIAAPWFAPAGLNRGLAGSGIIRADVKLTKFDRDTLYQGRINPIATFVQQGVSIWGQKTLQNRQSALDRINVRRLLLQVRRLIAAASLTLVFEQNDQTLRDQFLAKVEPILLQIQNQRGLTAFKVVMDDSNNTADTIDRNTLVGKIQLKPTRTAEFIDLTFQVLPTGANFQDF
jgi:hypothetical protein